MTLYYRTTHNNFSYIHNTDHLNVSFTVPSLEDGFILLCAPMIRYRQSSVGLQKANPLLSFNLSGSLG